MCVEAIRKRDDVVALYGFSGGGYNIRHVLAALSVDERKRIKLIVVLGAPNNPPELYRDGPWELVYRLDPPAGHMAGPKALLAELAPEATAANGNPLAGKALRYLIGADAGYAIDPDAVTEVGYDAPKPATGTCIAYCNLFDERTPAITVRTCIRPTPPGNTARGRSIRSGPGWDRNLREQFERRKRQGFRYVELDNPDAYPVRDVLRAVDLAASYGFEVIAKNPLLIDGDPLAYVAHSAVAGVIVEQGAGSPQEMEALRRRAGKPDLPVWFVAFGGSDGRAWAIKIAQQAEPHRHMGVTFSNGGEYTSCEDVLLPDVTSSREERFSGFSPSSRSGADALPLPLPLAASQRRLLQPVWRPLQSHSEFFIWHSPIEPQNPKDY